VTGTLHTVDGRSVLRFERRLAHPMEKVWRALTEPAELAHWFPATMETELRVGAPIRFEDRNHPGEPLTGEITELDPPRLFAYTWSDSELRWELRPDGAGCVLMFTHTFDDRPAAASYATGWDGCLDALETSLAGGSSGDPTAQYAERHEAYVDAFDLLEGHVDETRDGWRVRFERQFPHPIDAVWSTLTGGDEPTVGDPPPAGFTNGYVPATPVTAAEPPTTLEYATDAGHVRWQLASGPGGARVNLTHTIPRDAADHTTTALAAWHTHLELLGRQLRGADVCPWPEERTEELRRHYGATSRPRDNVRYGENDRRL
jgi:uncharacterized protein YndB with AHSA1/START domain